MMKVTKTQEGSKLTVAVEGRLDTMTAPQMEDELSPIPEEIPEMVFDFSELAYISSAGLRVLVACAQNMRNRDGKMSIVNVSSDVRNIFDITGLSEPLGVK